MKKIVFFSGNSQGAADILNFILLKRKYQIVAVVLRIIKKSMKHFDNEVLTKVVKKNNLKILTIKNINSKNFRNLLKSLRPDLFCNYGYTHQLFKSDLLKIPKFGTLNYHPGLLPYGRGTGAIVGEIINGATFFGRTCHLMNEKFDSGTIINQESFKISNYDNMGDISKILSKDTDKFFLKSIDKVFSKKKSYKKINNFGRYYPKFVAGDEYIDFNNNSINIYRKIISRLPEKPSVCYLKNNLEEIKVIEVELNKQIKPYIFVTGQVIDKSESNGILVKTGDTAIWIKKIIKKNKILIPNFKIGTCFLTLNIYDFTNIVRSLKNNHFSTKNFKNY